MMYTIDPEAEVLAFDLAILQLSWRWDVNGALRGCQMSYGPRRRPGNEVNVVAKLR